MIISKGNLKAGSLQGKIAVITGAGQGIGLEAAKSLAWLGARVVIAEINSSSGRTAAESINEFLGPGKAIFIHTDVGNEDSVAHLKRTVESDYGDVSIIINNATITPIGSAPDVPIDQWDTSYRVNLRGPALMAIEFIPGMVTNNSGVFISVASLGEAYLTAYETFKVAQVRMATTLNYEMRDKNVYCLSINPGLVRTPRAVECVKVLAPIYGKTVDEFFQTGDRLISAEAAGAGFAAAVVLAEQFRGQEITSRQALEAAGISAQFYSPVPAGKFLPENLRKEAEQVCGNLIARLTEQAISWSDKPPLEGQYLYQDFKKITGMPMESWLAILHQLETNLEQNTPWQGSIPLEKLGIYYDHLQKNVTSHQIDEKKREEQVLVFKYCQKEVQELKDLIETKPV